MRNSSVSSRTKFPIVILIYIVGIPYTHMIYSNVFESMNLLKQNTIKYYDEKKMKMKLNNTINQIEFSCFTHNTIKPTCI